MMSLIDGVLLVLSSSTAASMAAKATVIAGLGLAAARLAGRSRAAVRHALLAAAFGVLLVMPVVSLVAPPVRVAVRGAAPGRSPQPARASVIAALPQAAQAHAGSEVPLLAGVSPAAVLFAGWVAGTALFLLPVFIGLWQVRRLRRSAQPWRQGGPVVETLALDAGIRRRVAVLLHEALPGPMTCGIVRPAIVLPADARTWDAEDLNRAIVHELEHVRRGDWATQCLARAVCAVYWFHPLVWLASRRLALEAERSCDDAVLGRSEPTAYADQLVALAHRLSLAAAAKPALLAMASHADLAARIGAVLDSRQPRGRAGTLPVALACGGAFLLALTISPLTMVAAAQSAGADAPPMGRFLSRSALVVQAVKVTGQNGKDVEGLSAGDFVVTEDGAAQKISIFEYQKASDPSLSSYYILGYYSSAPNASGQFRQLVISLKDNTNARLEYRPGYYTRSSPDGAFSGIPNGAAGGSVDRSIRPPVLIFKKEPEYTEAARKAKYQGAVVLQLEVSVTGEAANIQVIRALGLGLDEKAVEAVNQWRFRPGTKDGKPVAAPVQVAVEFRLL
jgi:TonB family protein